MQAHDAQAGGDEPGARPQPPHAHRGAILRWLSACVCLHRRLHLNPQEFKDVKFVKCNCNKDFKDVGKALAIKVAPTFHLYKGGQQVAVMTGAKVDELRELIVAHK